MRSIQTQRLVSLSQKAEAKKTDQPSWTEDSFYEAQALGLGDLTPVALILVVVIIAVAIGAYVVNTIGATFAANSVASNVTTNGAKALNQFSTWFVIIVVVVAAAIIIGLLIRSFYGGGAGGKRV